MLSKCFKYMYVLSCQWGDMVLIEHDKISPTFKFHINVIRNGICYWSYSSCNCNWFKDFNSEWTPEHSKQVQNGTKRVRCSHCPHHIRSCSQEFQGDSIDSQDGLVTGVKICTLIVIVLPKSRLLRYFLVLKWMF